MSPSTTPGGSVSRAGMLRAFAWYAAVVTIALGSAGLIVELDHPATAGARPELTARGDRIVDAWLPRLREVSAALPAEADAVAAAAGDAFTALGASDPGTARERLLAGRAALGRVAAVVSDMRSARTELDAGLGTAPVADGKRAALDGLDDALAAADGLPVEWRRSDAEVTRVAAAIDEAPREAAAILEASSGRLVEALVAIDRARGRIAAGVAALD